MSLPKPKDILIYKNRLIQELLGIRDTIGDIFLSNVLDRAISCVANQPEADPGYAEWIDASSKYKFAPGKYQICSNCDVMVPIPIEFPIFRFCPNCGKRMRIRLGSSNKENK